MEVSEDGSVYLLAENNEQNPSPLEPINLVSSQSQSASLNYFPLAPNNNEESSDVFKQDLIKFVEVQIQNGASSGSVSGVADDENFSEIFNSIRNTFRESVVNALFPNTAFDQLPNLAGSPIEEWSGWPGSGGNAPAKANWDSETWMAFTNYLESLPADLKTELRTNPIYNPNSSGEWRRQIASAYFRDTRFGDLPQSSSPLSWTGWPGSKEAKTLSWEDPNVWQQFVDYLNGLPEATRQELLTKSKEAYPGGYEITNLPDTSKAPQGGWGWQARQDLWDQVTDNGQLLPSGDFDFTFISSVEGGGVKVGDTVIVKGAWGEHFRNIFDSGLWQANWFIRSQGGSNGEGGPDDLYYEGGSSGEGGAGIVNWLAVNQPVTEEETDEKDQPVVDTTNNKKKDNSSEVFLALIGPAQVLLIPLISGLANSLLPANVIGTPMAAAVPAIKSATPESIVPGTFILTSGQVQLTAPAVPTFQKVMW
ncbi:MAG: hypothetical protein SFU25_10625 [Candidatus Caenarcaniphilales bacterium]|nr:hypothetical protein [Candidatus Caenarcaniphilales bacterium]